MRGIPKRLSFFVFSTVTILANCVNTDIDFKIDIKRMIRSILGICYDAHPQTTNLIPNYNYVFLQIVDK